jgi:hypothetical protein
MMIPPCDLSCTRSSDSDPIGRSNSDVCSESGGRIIRSLVKL